jgi:superfamily I DNA/RNA helicase
VIRFATAQAFKGMESSVVVLCDVEKIGDAEPQSLLYVAMSRARSQLTVLVHEQAKPSISECVRRKLQEGWNKNP